VRHEQHPVRLGLGEAETGDWMKAGGRPVFPRPERVVRVGAELCGQWRPDSAGLEHAIATGVFPIPAVRIGFVPTLFAQGLADDAHDYGQTSKPWGVASAEHTESPRIECCRRLQLHVIVPIVLTLVEVWYTWAQPGWPDIAENHMRSSAAPAKIYILHTAEPASPYLYERPSRCCVHG